MNVRAVMDKSWYVSVEDRFIQIISPSVTFITNFRKNAATNFLQPTLSIFHLDCLMFVELHLGQHKMKDDKTDSRSEIVFFEQLNREKKRFRRAVMWIKMFPHIVYIMCVNNIKWMLFQIQISTCLSTHQNCRRSVKWGLACIHYAGRAWWRGGQRSPAPASGIKEVLSTLLPQPACEGEHQHR